MHFVRNAWFLGLRKNFETSIVEVSWIYFPKITVGDYVSDYVRLLEGYEATEISFNLKGWGMSYYIMQQRLRIFHNV